MSEHRDPAREAAQRAGTDDDGEFLGKGLYGSSVDYAESAAREALAPIRLESRRRTGR